MNYKDYITIDANIRFGKPVILGTRIAVYDVLSWFASGMTVEEIIEDYPELNKEQIQACFAYAADKEHKISIAS
ncbi:DUF433 domain-containing protein [Flavobacterium coralii]|uniref:DUF433 domain-containing protein n=1 Tax=Flavobacterium TaxID=237 RepID=UPI000C4C9E66|nr:hypothetical protein [Flavobacterium sp.]